MSKRPQLRKNEYLKDVEERAGSRYKPFSIEPLRHERQRLATPMSAEDRARRQTWLKDQALSPDEPRFTLRPENPIKRIYRLPVRLIHGFLSPMIGVKAATHVKNTLGVVVPAYLASLFIWYHMKYRQGDWERNGGLYVYNSPKCDHVSGSHINNKAAPKEYLNEHTGFSRRTALKYSDS